jgi:hypothetical protein
MPTFNQVIIRCELYPDEVGKDFVTRILNGRPAMNKGAQVEFQFGLFAKRATKTTPAVLYDISNIAGNPLLRIRQTNKDGVLLLDHTVTGCVVAKDQSLDLATWEDGTKQHFRFYFPETATGITEGRQYIVVYGPDGDVYGSANIDVVDPGTGAAASPTPSADGYYTKAEVKALMEDFMRKIGKAGETRALTSKDGKYRIIEELINDADGVRLVANIEEIL